ncbi:hypothetical protein IL306_002788 [Fusarium sp. DS 682]|nr:hypothetical protein IL306_002788 [Fusarium sp. DS 682]
MSLPSSNMTFTREFILRPMVFFDLDNTLFDHQYSLYHAMFAVQFKFSLNQYSLKELADAYNKALNVVYDKYLRKEITREGSAVEKVRLFTKTLGREERDPHRIKEFRELYQAAYQENRRAIPGSIEALTQLRKDGYRTAIITNGPTKQQIDKAKTIGVYDLVERIITSEEAGHTKPDVQIFEYAMEKLEISPECAYMVGDSVECDTKGAIDADMVPILYDSCSKGSSQTLFGEQVAAIRSFDELPTQLASLMPALVTLDTLCQRT